MFYIEQLNEDATKNYVTVFFKINKSNNIKNKSYLIWRNDFMIKL